MKQTIEIEVPEGYEVAEGERKLGFPRFKATPFSLSRRKKVLGVGVNDAYYLTQTTVNGIKLQCPAYQAWSKMISRCYDQKIQSRYPSYQECSVSDEWLTFSNFLDWFELAYFEGCRLDKDIKVKGNKLYSKETCLLVPEALNNLLTHSKSVSGKWPTGVRYHKHTDSYTAVISIDNKPKSLGYHKTPEEASEAYIKAKNKEIDRQAGIYPKYAKYLEQHKL